MCILRRNKARKKFLKAIEDVNKGRTPVDMPMPGRTGEVKGESRGGMVLTFSPWLKPEPNSIKQEIQEIVRVTCHDAAETGKCHTHDKCSTSPSPCVYLDGQVADILALLQPQQPAEGELISDEEIERLILDIYPCWDVDTDPESFELGVDFTKAQLAHMIAKGWLSPEQAKEMVKLPSEDKFRKIFVQAVLRYIYLNEENEACWDDYNAAKDFLKLLKEQGEEKPCGC